MKKGAKLTRLAYEGEAFTLEFYVSEAGESLAEDWLENQSEALQQKFAALFVRLGDHGRIWNERKFKHLTGSKQIFEFKAEQGRILCFFFHGKRAVLTHGFKKKSNKTPPNEVQRAERLKQDFERRVKK